MPRGPKKKYTGRGGHLQIRVSDDEDRAVKAQAKMAGFEAYADYIRYLIEKDSGRISPVPIQHDPVRPENRDIHKRFELIWNSLNDIERSGLEGILERFAPKLKGKRAS